MSQRQINRMLRKSKLFRVLVVLVAVVAIAAPYATDYAEQQGWITVPDQIGTVPGVDVTADEAEAMLRSLVVADPQSMAGYDRAHFTHWSDINGNGCTARQETLYRDGEDVEVGDSCNIEGGSWPDPLTDEVMTESRSVDIDHMVPLAEAWRSGAQAWNDERRKQFANDPINLIATSQNANRTKGDKTPDLWMPPARESHQAYAIQYIAVKHKYDLTVTAAERQALAKALNL